MISGSRLRGICFLYTEVHMEYGMWNEVKEERGNMRYKIWGNPSPAVSIELQSGESIYTQSGGMTWMRGDIDMQTNMRGGLGKAFGRMFSGESAFLATYTARGAAEITFASSVPGTIKAIELTGRNEYIAQKGAFLCATQGVDISASLTKAKGGFFGGEGFVLQRYSGVGMIFLELDGSIGEYELAPGESMLVDTGNVAFFEASVQYSAQMQKGIKNALFGGEGLFLTKLTGPGKVWLQTMSISELASRIRPFMPSKD